MSYIYNPEKGQFENPEQGLRETQLNPTIPQLTEEERSAAEELCQASRVSSDPADFVGACELAAQAQARSMAENGLILLNPSVLVNIAEPYLPNNALLDFMAQRQLMHADHVDYCLRLVNSQKNRQRLPTGGMLLFDRGLQMRGANHTTMRGNICNLNQGLSDAAQDLVALRLDIAPSLQLCCQSPAVLKEMNSEGSLYQRASASAKKRNFIMLYGTDTDKISLRQSCYGNQSMDTGLRIAAVAKPAQ